MTLCLRGLIVLLLSAGTALRADVWQRAPLTRAEVVQGFRNDVVLAQPRVSRRATADAEEQAEGSVVRLKFERFGNIRAIQVRGGESPAAAIQRLMATGRYEYVEVDHLRHAFDTIPNDPLFSQQWALANTGTNSPLSGPGLVNADIHAPAAWDIRHDASGIVVATVDSGLRLTHTDIVANLWNNPQANTDGFTNDQHGIDATNHANNGAPNDLDGHGTHVAGIIGASGNNGNGVSGIAWNVQLMALKFLGPDGGATSDELTCFTYAISHGVKIINASYGDQFSSASELRGIQGLADAGIILVCAAGNSTENNELSPSYPTSYIVDNIVSVAASDNKDSLVYFSSYGSGDVDLAAPGYNILSLYNTDDNATMLLSGTSMATPMVTGSLALLKAQFPADNYRQTINRLLRHVDRSANFIGQVASGGRLNLQAALASGAGENTPFNDNFADRSRISGYTITTRGSNAGATRENGEPVFATGTATGSSLWYEWTAPTTGQVKIISEGTVASPLIGVYTGSSVDALTAVTSGVSTVGFAAQAGITYELAVDSQYGAYGLLAIQLQYTDTAPATATALSGINLSVTDTTAYGTARGTPKILNRTPDYTIWYSWTAPATAQVQLAVTSPDFDPLLAIYTGTPDALNLVTSAVGTSIDPDAVAPVSGASAGFVATAGTTYLIELGGAPDATTDLLAGQFTLTINSARWAAWSSDAFDCSPAVAPDGTIITGADNGSVYAFNPDGTPKWSYSTTGAFDTSSVAIAPDGTVYAGGLDGVLYALTPAGTLKWKYTVPNAGEVGVACSPALAADGTIYFKDTASTLYALNPIGTVKWTAVVPGESYAAPVIAPDGTIYIGSDDGAGGGKLYAFSADGASKWSFDPGNAVYTAVTLDAAGRIYFATLGGVVYALDPAGQPLWRYAAGGGISSSLALGTNGILYFGCYDHQLYALSAASGGLQWTYPLGAQVRASSPAIDSRGVVYVGCYDGLVYGISADGTLSRTLATGNYIRSSPMIAGTTLYVGSADCRFYAFDLGASLSASPWPAYMADNRRTGDAAAQNFAIVTEPSGSGAVVASTPLTLSAAVTGAGPLTYQWYRNGAALGGAVNSSLQLLSPSSSDYGSYTVTVSGPQGTLTSSAEVLGPLAAPAITAQPANQSVLTGGTVNLTVGATGGNLSYQWYFAGTALLGATGPNLLLTNVGADRGAAYGSFTVAISNSLGSVISGGASLRVTTQAQLLNLSARGQVGAAASDYLAVGFVTTASAKKMLIRGAGPALAGFSLPNFLPDPALTLFNTAAPPAVLAANAGWANDAAISAAFTATGAFAFDASSSDAALLRTLPAGGYSAQINGARGDTGLVLAEIYDDDPTAAGRLINLSARAQVGSGANIAAAGFVISGSTSETVLIRGVGPSLSGLGVSGALSAASLTLYTAGQTALQTNSNWASTSGLGAVFLQVGAFPLASSGDAALIVTLPPGSYTAQLSGVGAATGVALVEIYEVR